jgi:cutinase
MFAKKLLALVLIATTAFAAPLVEESAARPNCTDVTVFFARGTTEPGTLGIIVGPGLWDDLQTALGPKSLTFTGIRYPADVAGFLAGGDAEGAQRMLNSVSSTANSCPDTKIVMSGYRQASFTFYFLEIFFIDVVSNYSQGAQLIHLAAANLSTEDQNHVAAVVTFGDPYRDQVLPGDLESRRDTFCAEGDLICEGKPIVLPPHFSYGKVSELFRHSKDNMKV